MPLGLSIENDQQSGATIEIASSESGATLEIADSKNEFCCKLEGHIIRETTVHVLCYSHPITINELQGLYEKLRTLYGSKREREGEKERDQSLSLPSSLHV